MLLASRASDAQDVVDGFVGRIYKNVVRRTMPYRLFIPPNYDKTMKYPLVLWLHGAGGAGNDNRRQIEQDQVLGTHLWTSAEFQATHPTFVVVPQTTGTWTESGRTILSQEMLLVLGIVDSIQTEFNIDAGRLYVLGQSDGGFGVWNLIINRPDMFAAAVPLCGGGNPNYASRLTKLPIWAFHGALDISVPVVESRRMIQAIKDAGGNPRYTEYGTVSHDVWRRAFAEPELAEWLFSRHK